MGCRGDRARPRQRTARGRNRQLLQPVQWLVFDADLSLSKARFTVDSPAGTYVPEAVGTVVSAGASLDGFHRAFGSMRISLFGSRGLTQDDTVRSKPTTLVNLGAGYELAKNLRVTADIFNVFDARDSDIDYYFTSRLPGRTFGRCRRYPFPSRRAAHLAGRPGRRLLMPPRF